MYSIGAPMYKYVFRDSSQWIYKNTGNNAYDTVFLTQMDRAVYPQDTGDECVDLKKETFFLNCRSSYTASSFYYFVSNGSIRLDGRGVWPYWGAEIFNNLNTVGDSTTESRLVAVIPSMLIQGHAIYNIRKIEVLNYSFAPQFTKPTYLYWAPDIGIVRKEIGTGSGTAEVWDLYDRKLNYY